MGLLGGSPKTDLLNDGQKAVSDLLAPYIRGAVGRQGESYPGQVVPDLLPGYSQVQNLLGQVPGATNQAMQNMLPLQRQLIQQTLPGAARAQAMISGLSNPLQGSQGLNQANTQRTMQQGVANPMQYALSQNQGQASSGFGGMFGQQAGASKGTMQGDLQSGMDQMNGQYGFQNQMGQMQLNDQTAQMNMGRALQASQYQQSLGQMNLESTKQGFSSLGQMSMLPLQQALGMGETLGGMQAQKQAQYNAKYQDWLRTLPENSPWTQLAIQFGGMQTKMPGQQENIAGSMLGGAASGAAAGSMFGPWGTVIGAGVGGIAGAL